MDTKLPLERDLGQSCELGEGREHVVSQARASHGWSEAAATQRGKYFHPEAQNPSEKEKYSYTATCCEVWAMAGDTGDLELAPTNRQEAEICELNSLKS